MSFKLIFGSSERKVCSSHAKLGKGSPSVSPRMYSAALFADSILLRLMNWVCMSANISATLRSSSACVKPCCTTRDTSRCKATKVDFCCPGAAVAIKCKARLLRTMPPKSPMFTHAPTNGGVGESINVFNRRFIICASKAFF